MAQRDLLKIKHIPIYSALASANKKSKTNLIPNTMEEGKESLTKLELLCRTLVDAKIYWEEGKSTWQDTLKKLKVSTSSG